MDLLHELRAVWVSVPIPGESWHPWTPELRRLDELVRAAADTLEGDETARRELEALVDAEEPPPLARAGELAEAVELLERLPRPVGHHPYLHEILPGLEAAELLVAAAARTTRVRDRP